MINENKFKQIRKEIQGKWFKDVYNGKTHLNRMVKVKQNEFNSELLEVFYTVYCPKIRKGKPIFNCSYEFAVNELYHFYNLFDKRIRNSECKKLLQQA